MLVTCLIILQNCDYVRVDGSTAAEKRQSEVAKFQEKSSCKVALLSITAANMGFNLHAASLVVFAELFWNPGVRTMMVDRNRFAKRFRGKLVCWYRHVKETAFPFDVVPNPTSAPGIAFDSFLYRFKTLCHFSNSSIISVRLNQYNCYVDFIKLQCF